MTSPDVEERVKAYEQSRQVCIESRLGVGTQGSVYVVNNPSQSQRIAVKFHERQAAYDRETRTYLRLRDYEVTHVCGHRVPILLGHDDKLLAIEMTIVSPPFALDFGGAYLDQPPDYSPEVWDDWRKMKADAFEDNWPAIQNILREFETFGIYVADVNPGNIRF